MAFPFFLYGDASLVSEHLTLTTVDGKVVTSEYMASPEAVEKYRTYVDVEPASCKTMNARNRLMAAFAIGKTGQGKPITDVLHRTVPTEVIIPVYWGQERVTLTSAIGDRFSTVQTLTGATLPVFIMGLLLGLGLVGAGLFIYRRSTTHGKHNPPMDA